MIRVRVRRPEPGDDAHVPIVAEARAQATGRHAELVELIERTRAGALPSGSTSEPLDHGL